MLFRIHSASPELKRELESRLAELEGQVDAGFEYEISAESLPRQQALARVESLTNEIGAEAVFVAEGVFANEAPQDEDPDFAMGLPPVADEQRTAENGRAKQQQQRAAEGPSTSLRAGSSATQEIRRPRIDAQKLRESVNAAASRAREAMQRAGEKSAAALKVAGERTGHLMRDGGEWTSQKAGEARVASGRVLSRLATRSEQWRASVAQRNAQREERRRLEAEARRERQRAAHREAELAAISAQVMLERQKQDERGVAEAPRRRPELKPVLRPAKPVHEERDMWPVWRNAFVVAACIALIGVFLLATGSKQSNGAPATSTELSKPAVVVPSHSVEQPKVQTIMPQQMAQTPQKTTAAKPVARKRMASSADEDDEFQEVTVRHYSNASPLAPPKKNSQGVVQISDME